MIPADRLAIAPEVADALRDGRPVVALESTLISHGLPYPQNVEVATASEAAVRVLRRGPGDRRAQRGPAAGRADGDQLEALATAPRGSVRKVSRPNLGLAIASGEWGATTVAATMIAAQAAGIRVFATGGIGGVHIGAIDGDHPTLDISADLDELARTRVAVVCAGPKAILDVPRTLEYLETRGVPVVAVGIDEVPGFYSRAVRDPGAVARPGRRRRGRRGPGARGDGADERPRDLQPGAGGGRPARSTSPATPSARRSARRTSTGVSGGAVTPWLLARVAALTNGASVKANISLITDNARVAGLLASELARPA